MTCQLRAQTGSFGFGSPQGQSPRPKGSAAPTTQIQEVQRTLDDVTGELQAQKRQIQMILEMQKQNQLLIERNIIYNQRAIMANQRTQSPRPQ